MWAGSLGLPNRPREKLTVFHTVSKASVVSSWGTRPMRARASRQSFWMSQPSTTILPFVARTIPQMIEIRVVLPAPLGPSSAKISPLSMARFTSLSAGWPEA